MKLKRKLTTEHKNKIGIGNKGKHSNNYIERFGEEKANEIKKKQSDNCWSKKMKGNFPKETLEKKRQNMSGNKNPMYGIRGSESPFWKGGDKESSKRSYKNNTNFRLKKLIRTRIRQVLNRQIDGGKIKKSNYYGIDVEAIVNHLSKQLPNNFTSGDYDIHHINDLINFDLNNPEEIAKAFAPSNHTIILRDEHKNHHKVNISK